MATASQELYKGQRSNEKRQLWGRFCARAIEQVYRRRFFLLFDNRCFKCGRPERDQIEQGIPPVLCVDHHVPMALGGHLVPGNLVSLCRECNGRKLDLPPGVFYTADEFDRLRPLLDAQEELFKFQFDPDRWYGDREAYLLDIGVDPETVRSVITDELHPLYEGLPDTKVNW